VFDKAILVFMHQGSDNLLEPFSQQLSNEFHGAVEQGDWPVIRDS
jgi:hypothetical protein